MKYYFFSILLIMSFTSNAQNMNKQVHDKLRNTNILLNECDRNTLVNFEEFKTTYDNFYRDYKVDDSLLIELKKVPLTYHIVIVLGTWCGDSKYWVPNFLKVMDQIGLPEKSLKFIAADGNKKAEHNLIDNLNILKVPTFIIYDKNNKELGRIIEGPQETLEIELLKILKKAE